MSLLNHTSAPLAGRARLESVSLVPGWRGLAGRLSELRDLGLDLGVRGLERLAGHRRSDLLDFKIGATARDLILEKSRAVRDEMELLARAVMRAGSYPAREEATRALHAVMDALRERVPPEVLLKLVDHLPEGEAARLKARMRQGASLS